MRWITAVLIVFALALFMHSVTAQEKPPAARSPLVNKFVDGDNVPGWLKLYHTDCKDDKTIAAFVGKYKLPSVYVLLLQRSVINWKGKDYESCWLEIDDKVYSVSGEDGALLEPPPPMRRFREEGV